MRVHVFQHVEFEGLGSIEAWLKRRDAKVSFTRFYQNPTLPKLEDVDLLIAMGGPMSVNDEDALPWLRAEKQFVREAILSSKPVLGVCLGAQLIANAMGARVYQGKQKEIGWFQIQSVAQAKVQLPFSLDIEVFHWHGETFDLPSGAIHLAKSIACEHQAFQIMDRAIGLQFHLEMTPESVKQIIANCRQELVASQYIQTEDQILSTAPDLYLHTNQLMSNLLDYLVR